MSDFPVVIDAGALQEHGFTIATTNTGCSVVVTNAGDTDGDGIDDLVVQLADFVLGFPLVGAVYVISGALIGPSGTIDLSFLDPAPERPLADAFGDNGYRLDGLDKYDITGFAAAAAGDINGDGFGDMLISAPGADPDGDDVTPGPTPAAGVTYVVFGSATPPPTGFSLGDLDGANGFRIDGVAAYDYSGWSVDGIGDFNGDGLDDILIGAYRVDGDGVGDYSDYTGASYVVFGSDDPFAASMDLADLDGANGFRIDGLEAGDRMGRSVAGAGDVNGDGIADLIVGAHSADAAGFSNVGASYVVFGSATPFGAAFDLADLDGANGFRVRGIEIGDHSGSSVSSAGDFNGDGFDDLIIGAYGVDVDGPSGLGYQGAAYVVFGSDAPFASNLFLSDLDGSNGFRLRGDAADGYAEAGVSVSSAGDVNGDGFDDLLIGAEGTGAPPSGSVFVVFGSAAPFAADFDLTTLDGGNGFRIDAANDLDYAGSTVSAAGDINGDGFDDIAVSARGADGDGDDGEGYVIYGRAPTTAVSRVGSDADQVIRGGDFNDTLNGGKGADTLIGGDGDDRYVLNSALDRVIEGAGGGEDRVLIAKSYALTGGEEIERLRAKNNASTTAIDFDGNTIGNALIGNAGASRLRGFGGDDELRGLAGDDRLYGGVGEDALDGGAGLDRFYFDSALNPATNVDRIVDFTPTDDSIYLDRAEFGAIDAGKLDGAAFRLGTGAQDASDRIIYDSASGKLWYDADGTGAAAKQLFARVTPGTALTKHDFFGYGTAAAPLEQAIARGESAAAPAAPRDLAAEALGWVDFHIP